MPTVSTTGLRATASSLQKITSTFAPMPISLPILPGDEFSKGHTFQVVARAIPLLETVRAPGEDLADWEIIDSSSADGAFVEFCPANVYPEGIARKGKVIQYAPYEYDRYYVDAMGTFDDYFSALPSRRKAKLRFLLSRFERNSGHKLTYRCYTAPEQFPDFFRAADTILRNRGGLNPRPLPVTDAYLKLASEAARIGAVRAYLLFSREVPIAFMFFPIADGAMIYDYIGYHAAYAHSSPGLLLLSCVIQDLFAAKPCRYLDFTQGEGYQKRFFATNTVRCTDTYFIRFTEHHESILRAHYVACKQAWTRGR